MGEAKRRRQLDTNFGNPFYSKGGKAIYSHHLAPAPSIHQTSVDAYEQYARETVIAEQTALLQQARGARTRLRNLHKEQDLCLIVMRTFDETDQIRMKFDRIEETKRTWLNIPRYLPLTPTAVDTIFGETLSVRRDNEFIWTHIDVLNSGIVTRLVPIANAEIARICHL